MAYELGISQSEISESLNRSVVAGLLAADKKTLMKSALLDFLKFGLRYVFPQKPSAVVRGLATAHSAPPLSQKINAENHYVWPWAQGRQRGAGIQPLHPSVPSACLEDERLYELLALTEALRVGKAREQKLAIRELEKRL